MPRYKNSSHQNQEKITSVNKHCSRIRKRVSSSSSTSSSVVKNYRFKRAILVGKSINYCSNSIQNLPTWKVIMAGSKSPMQKMQDFENGVKFGKNGIISNNNNNNYHNNNNYNKGKESLSARKLAANLWEVNEMHSPGRVVNNKDDVFEERKTRKSCDKLIGKLIDGQQHLFLDQIPYHSPVSEKKDRSKGGSHRRRSSATSQKLEITEFNNMAVARTSSTEFTNHDPGENNLNIKTQLKGVSNSLIASKELVKVLYRIMSQEEHQSSRLTIVSALRVELDRARLQVDQLTQEQRYNCNQVDALFKQFAEEKAVWKSKEKQKIKEAISSLAKEVEIERKLRKQAERLNKKLGIELGETRGHFGRAMKELEEERRAREILEQTCDELARGIGEERVEVEEIKKESEKEREEVEKEREMLQLADVLREERVQMKLEEAKYEYEEKNAALERLKSELGIYLKNGENIDNGDKSKSKSKSPYFDGVEDFNDFLKTMKIKSFDQNGEVDDESDDDGDSDSELHSIELNMDNRNKCYKWSFDNNGNNEGDSRRTSIDEVFKGRRSLSEKIQWESICLQKNTSDGIEWDFTASNLQAKANSNAFIKGKPSQNGETNENDNQFMKYNPVKSHRLISRQDSDSPAMSTCDSSRLREACSAILQDLAAKRGDY